MSNHPTRQPEPESTATHAQLRQLLTETRALLGPSTPLPALYEEVLRRWQQRPVGSVRFQQFQALVQQINQLPDGLPALAGFIHSIEEPLEIRLLAATVWAHLRPETPTILLPGELPICGDDPAWLPPMMATLPFCDPTGRFTALLEILLTARQITMPEPEGSPEPLVLLGFLKGVWDRTLSPSLFSAAVLYGQVLHPAVAAHRPLHHLNRLLDYVGLSADAHFARMYRQLVATMWPQAEPANWPLWQWVTLPGGPEIFPNALSAVANGELGMKRFHELRYAALPPSEALPSLLTSVDCSLAMLLGWLRVDLREALGEAFPALPAMLRWLMSSNAAAAETAYTGPDWWEGWCSQGLPAARQVIRWLEEIAVPTPPHGQEPAAWRHRWLEEHLLPNFPLICANLLLAHASLGENLDDILALAETEHLPAIRALALVPQMNEGVFNTLRRLGQAGGRPAQAAAKKALDHLARRQGLPGAEELGRQHLLAAAWELGPLAGERVRVGWQQGAYRLRLSLQAGKVQLEIIGPRGPVSTIPADLRQSDAYRSARAAQRETQAQYRLFRQHLEGYLLNGTPLSSGEFRYLLTNPVFAHLAERLLWRVSGEQAMLWAGPERWELLSGEPVALHNPLTLSLVHPVELDRDGVLGRWQSLAADRRLMQPFKQLFREIYTLGGEEGERSERFAGRSIDPRRAYALLRASGFAPGNGTARREWPLGVTAHLCWAAGAGGRDLFGPHRKREVTTGEIWFTRDGETLPLPKVEPIIFSETLRAADLLTTRAAIGEAELTSRETVALRALLLRETARTFRLTNIAVPEDGRFAVVLGARATYRVNLTTGTVMLEPEGRQILVPKHDTRWRPVEDGDATTEILAITLTLAHDEEVQDLAFLAQVT